MTGAVERWQLSPAQRWLLLLRRRETPSALDLTTAVVLPLASGMLAIQASIRRLFDRHPALRLEIVRQGGAFYQRPRGDPIEVTEHDLRPVPPEQRWAAVEDWVATDPGLNLQELNAPVARAGVAAFDDSSAVVVIRTNHVCSDRHSQALLRRDLLGLFSAVTGSGGELPPVRELFAPHADELARQARSEIGRAVQTRLLEELDGAPALRLPLDRPRQAQRGPARRVLLSLSPAQAAGVRRTARSGRSTPFAVLLAAAARVFSAWSKQPDFIVQSELANRPRRSFDEVVGCFAGPAFIRLSQGPHLDAEVRTRCLALHRQPTVDAYELLSCCPGLHRDLLDPTAGSAMFQWLPALAVETPGSRNVSPDPMAGRRLSRPPMADLQWSVVEGDGLTLVAEYDASLFEDRTIERWAGCFADSLTTSQRTAL